MPSFDPPLPVTRRAPVGTAIAIVILTIATLWRLWPAVESTSFHRDEARWIGNSALLREWRDPFGDRWQDEGYRDVYGTIDEVNRRRSQPPFAMYMFGIGLIVQGEGLPTTGYWIMTEDSDWNAQHGNMPSESELRAARRTNVVIALLTVFALFSLGTLLTNRIGGLIAGLAYALHPLVLATSTRAWSDPLLVLWVVIAALAMAWLGSRPTIARGALVGMLLGLGAATKLSPLLLAAGVGGLAVVPIAWGLIGSRSVHSSAVRAGFSLLVVPALATITFIAVYPYLWTNPITHTKRMFDFRSLSFDLQAQASPHARVESLAEAVNRFGVQLGDRDSVGAVIADALKIDGGTRSALVQTDLVLAVLGWLLLANVIARRRFDPRLVLPLLLLGGQVASIALTFRLDYARYMLPILPATAIGIGAVFGLSWQAAIRVPHIHWHNLATRVAVESASD